MRRRWGKRLRRLAFSVATTAYALVVLVLFTLWLHWVRGGMTTIAYNGDPLDIAVARNPNSRAFTFIFSDPGMVVLAMSRSRPVIAPPRPMNPRVAASAATRPIAARRMLTITQLDRVVPLRPVSNGWGRFGFVFAPANFESSPTTQSTYIVPWWALWLPALVPLTVYVAFAIRRSKRHRRRRKGLCPTCGYDLRATPTRCPECGWTRAGASDGSAPAIS
jgi:hypothetical protein